jgi:hypothetical protein
MMGDLLKGFRNVTFPYNGAGDFATIDSAGATTIRNAKVSENNSAVPRDRLTFRYNYFKNANDVEGFRLGNTLPGAPFPEFREVFPASKSYDAHFYTLGFEKTFMDAMASFEVRVPLANTLDSDLDLIGSRPITTGIPAPRNVPNDGTLGNTDTELQDISFILKGVIWRNQTLLISGGTGFTIPTGEDAKVFVVDTYDDIQGLEPFAPGFNPAFSPFPVPSVFDTQQLGFGNNIRTRDFFVENEIYELSPFLAMAAVPTERTFLNAFLQVNLPLNSADVRYREQRVDVVPRDFFPNVSAVNQFGVQFGPGGTEGIFDESGSIEDQTLLQADIGGGYWLYRNRGAEDITGVASLLELHYTTTLEIGGVVELANTATLAVGYVAPLRDEFDKTFDGEVNVQFNLYR